MIQPIGTLTPKVFRGSESRKNSALETKKKMALMNAAGVSVISGATATVLCRNITSTWGHAGVLGALTSGVVMMFLAPNLLYKSGINTSKSKDFDTITKVMDSHKGSLESYSKTILKRAV